MPVDPRLLLVDATGMANFLEDMETGARQRLRSALAGFAMALKEIILNQDELGERAGITAHD